MSLASAGAEATPPLRARSETSESGLNLDHSRSKSSTVAETAARTDSGSGTVVSISQTVPMASNCQTGEAASPAIR
jgi:hypothetical protein